MYSPALLVHICGGIVGIVSGSTALVARKGSRLHRKSGDVFVISMMAMAAAGAFVAITKFQPVNAIAGTFTFYLVATAWWTVKRTDQSTSRVDLGLLLLGLATVGISAMFAWQAVLDPEMYGSVIFYLIVGSIALLSAAGDVRMFMRGRLTGAKRLVRHLWRMCFALLVAAGSFFIGTSSDPVFRRTGLRAMLFTPEIRKTHLPEVPVLIIAFLTIYWLFRVWFSKAYRTSRPIPQATLPSVQRTVKRPALTAYSRLAFLAKEKRA